MHDIVFSRTFRYKKTSQRWLLSRLTKLLPVTKILEDYQHPTLRFGDSSVPMELDLFLPDLGLAFEYQVFFYYCLLLSLIIGSTSLSRYYAFWPSVNV